MSVVSIIVYLLIGGIACLSLLFAFFLILERYGEQLFTAIGVLREPVLKKKSI
jgi:hypothetical protein